jgi:hypothetical protein
MIVINKTPLAEKLRNREAKVHLSKTKIKNSSFLLVGAAHSNNL